MSSCVFDNHHPAGDANNPTTTPIPVNDHRAVLNVAQYDWPQQTLENPDSSPLLARAACIRGYLDTNEYLMDKLLREDLEFLEKLNTRVEDGCATHLADFDDEAGKVKSMPFNRVGSARHLRVAVHWLPAARASVGGLFKFHAHGAIQSAGLSVLKLCLTSPGARQIDVRAVLRRNWAPVGVQLYPARAC
jgi:hypothetical protein